MFDRPRLALMITYGTLPNLAAYALINLVYVYAGGADPVVSWLLVLFVGFGSWYAVIVEAEAQLVERKENKSGRERPEPVKEFKPPFRVDGKIVNAFTTPQVEIDVMAIKIKRFSRTLITQRENHFKIDLREKTWEAHFGGRKNYVEARDVRMAGAFGKENPQIVNSPFTVIDWRVVESAANGRL